MRSVRNGREKRRKKPGSGILRELDRELYLQTLPAVVPAGFALVHKYRRRGDRVDFVYWLAPEGAPGLDLCRCGWAAELGPHFRLRWSHLDGG